MFTYKLTVIIIKDMMIGEKHREQNAKRFFRCEGILIRTREIETIGSRMREKSVRINDAQRMWCNRAITHAIMYGDS